MKVKLLVSRGGIDFSQSPGDVVEVSAAEGKRMIAAGQAEKFGKADPADDTVAGGGDDTVAAGANTVAGGGDETIAGGGDDTVVAGADTVAGGNA